MAQSTRIAFICKDNKLYQEYYTFEFFNGFALSQKRKSIESFHSVIRKQSNIDKILEISRKNENELGIKLSAFNLMINLNGKSFPVECIYQSSKVFGNQQFKECLDFTPKDAKNYVKEKMYNEKLTLTKFNLLGVNFPLEPKSYFYDYLYILALAQNHELAKQIKEYDCFTDIEYNHKKQFASQARSCALYKYLELNNLLDDYLKSPDKYLTLYENIQEKTLL